jgi:hypothetical protein
MATLKQKRAFKKISENLGNLGKTMREVGYAEATSLTPQNLTESKGWKELMHDELPDSLLAKRHRELLDKREIHIIKGKNGSEEVEVLDTPDTQAVSKGLDMAYKIGDKYAPEKHLNVNVEAEASDRIKELAKRLRELDA